MRLHLLTLIVVVLGMMGCQTAGKGGAVETALLTSAGHMAAVAYLDTVDDAKQAEASGQLSDAAGGVIAYLEGEGGPGALYGAVTSRLDGELGKYGPVLGDLLGTLTVSEPAESPVSEQDRSRAVAFLKGVQRGAHTQ